MLRFWEYTRSNREHKTLRCSTCRGKYYRKADPYQGFFISAFYFKTVGLAVLKFQPPIDVVEAEGPAFTEFPVF
jgi:hypothetical protein